MSAHTKETSEGRPLEFGIRNQSAKETEPNLSGKPFFHLRITWRQAGLIVIVAVLSILGAYAAGSYWHSRTIMLPADDVARLIQAKDKAIQSVNVANDAYVATILEIKKGLSVPADYDELFKSNGNLTGYASHDGKTTIALPQESLDRLAQMNKAKNEAIAKANADYGAAVKEVVTRNGVPLEDEAIFDGASNLIGYKPPVRK